MPNAKSEIKTQHISTLKFSAYAERKATEINTILNDGVVLKRVTENQKATDGKKRLFEGIQVTTKDLITDIEKVTGLNMDGMQIPPKKLSSDAKTLYKMRVSNTLKSLANKIY